jgi:catechol 2,3-dioxygenase-like lactoylglutathione lyase family enzyme
MPELTRMLETSLYVDDLARARRFYQEAMQFELMVMDDRFSAFNVAGRQVLLLFRRGGSLDPMPTPGGVIPPHDGSGSSHLAFAIEAAQLQGWETHLARYGIPIESRVRWDRGGTSLYFRDPDDNLIELATPVCGRFIRQPNQENLHDGQSFPPRCHRVCTLL